MHRRIAVVTDSAASLPREVAAKWGVRVVAQQVTVDGQQSDDALVGAADLAQALRSGIPVSTSPPPSPAFYWTYQDAIAAGAEAIVSVHVSGKMSATVEAARAAAEQVRVPVHVLDSGTVGMAMGFAVLAAAAAAETGVPVEQVVAAARARMAGGLILEYVQTLEYLRRGGRVSATRVWMANTFGVRPLLGVKDGDVVMVERLRGGEDKAVVRLADLAGRYAGKHPVDIAVEHFDNAQQAMRLANRLQAHIPQRRAFYLVEISSVVGVHTGPGTLGIAVSRC